MGNFHLPLDPAARHHYLGFAAGSGITPLLSIIKTTLAAEPQSRFTLVYGNRASSSIMFREELEDLKNDHLDRFALIHILSREQQDIDLFNGRIDKAKCEALLDHWLDIATVDAAFICGPQDMMLQVAETLQAHGLDQRRIKFELFATAEPGRRARRASAEAATPPETCARPRSSSTAARACWSCAKSTRQPAGRRAAGRHGAALCLQGRRLLDLPRHADRGPGRHGCQLRARGLRDRARLHPDLPELPDHATRSWSTSTSDGGAMTSDDGLASYLANGGKLSAPDNAPPRYRGELMRLMAVFVDSELAGASGFADCINLAPGVKERIIAARIVLEKFGHAEKVLGLLEQFGANTAAICQRPSLGRPARPQRRLRHTADRRRHAPQRLPLSDPGLGRCRRPQLPDGPRQRRSRSRS